MSGSVFDCPCLLTSHILSSGGFKQRHSNLGRVKRRRPFREAASTKQVSVCAAPAGERDNADAKLLSLSIMSSHIDTSRSHFPSMSPLIELASIFGDARDERGERDRVLAWIADTPPFSDVLFPTLAKAYAHDA